MELHQQLFALAQIMGLAIVFYVALEMIWTGTHQVGCRFVDKATCDSGAMTTLSTLLFS